MCRATKCQVCGKTTWAGCGEHVDAVRSTVPVSDWCDGDHTRGDVQGAATGSAFGGLFGR